MYLLRTEKSLKITIFLLYPIEYYDKNLYNEYLENFFQEILNKYLIDMYLWYWLNYLITLEIKSFCCQHDLIQLFTLIAIVFG